ncbi:phage tail tube protein [Oceanobacillus sp. CF4.6]|uniref:phage tail tube protein n=1 Tax=Oceanobacillus sp. CF4.6 TaxID=3373080 RepID=UPI003EE7F89F
MAEGLLINSKHTFEIGTGTDATTEEILYSRLAKGFSNFEPATNEENDQTAYLDSDGWLTTTVMGGQLTLNFSGHRFYGDEAQDYIFSKQFELGAGREAPFRWTLPSGVIIEGPATFAEITGGGGDAIAKGEITVAVHINGKPTITPAV